MKRIIAILSACALVASIFCLAGCAAQSNEQMIREKLTEELDAYKNADDETLSKIATVVENAGLQDAGIDSQEFATKVLDGFDYSIDDVKVEGNNATATVTIISKSSSDFQSRVTEAVQGITSDPSIGSMSQEEAVGKLGESVMQAFDDTEIVTETATIDYVLNDNIWEPVDAEASLADLDSIVFAK